MPSASLIWHAPWIRTTTNTVRLSRAFAQELAATERDTILCPHTIAAAVISVRDLCAWIVFAAAWAATDNEKTKYTLKHKAADGMRDADGTRRRISPFRDDG